MVPVLPREKGICIYEDWINEQGAALGNFIISVDPKGELGFLSNILEKKGRPAAHVIEALTHQVSAEYLTYLRKLGISYIFAGQDRLDCTLLLQKLQKYFNIENLMIAGGGVINWSFLQEGIIDEVRIVIAPIADGGTTSVSIFERADFMPLHSPVVFSLKEVQVFDGNVLWLRYGVVK